MELIVRASAPSNIALIKYMGKSDLSQNISANPSLSYTLNHLRSFVELEERDDLKSMDIWEPLEPGFTLSEQGQKRFLGHLQFLKSTFEVHGSFLLRSSNGFPQGCGLASSASSFAALTQAFAKYLERSRGLHLETTKLAQLSQKGSGSSIRSFFSPWAEWSGEDVQPLSFCYTSLIHQVIVVDSEQKKVSSSEAHRRVVQSELFRDRPERARRRLSLLKEHLLREDRWSEIRNIVWAEFWDMMALFETSPEPFGYLNARSLSVLDDLRARWDHCGDGPLVTMDAGPNVHLLYRLDQASMADQIAKFWGDRFMVLDSRSSSLQQPPEGWEQFGV